MPQRQRSPPSCTTPAESSCYACLRQRVAFRGSHTRASKVFSSIRQAVRGLLRLAHRQTNDVRAFPRYAMLKFVMYEEVQQSTERRL